ncbi:hypothetical protein JZX87_10510 [Agrobacterium sp. Ap1]|uniref:hypothetical protein n=1 Tax=Agrobacterium sp. Ap1 TaxID=2815337 RepID=UPI001A8DDB34|nr:hypothetical protein [Agrobacterium sp. Ap1]MBO0141589.1 hypothetical protein [Agrobacterium sp. Ap1]
MSILALAKILSMSDDSVRKHYSSWDTYYMPQFILDSSTYSRLLNALLAASTDAYVSKDTDAFKIALGEVAGIWPETVLASYSDANLEAPARPTFERPNLCILDIDAMIKAERGA